MPIVKVTDADKLPSTVNNPVEFRPPKDVRTKNPKAPSRRGKIVEEVWAEFIETFGDWGDYAFCSQLIEWQDGKRSIRLAYFRRKVGTCEWEIASQTTVESECAIIGNLLRRTLAQTSWF
jgi:hypothetical protein